MGTALEKDEHKLLLLFCKGIPDAEIAKTANMTLEEIEHAQVKLYLKLRKAHKAKGTGYPDHNPKVD
jgi:hypothetical protein